VLVEAEGLPDHIVRIDDGARIRLGQGGTVTGEGRVTVRPQGDEWLEGRYAETDIETFPAKLQAGSYRATWDDGRTSDIAVREGETTRLR
jgi:hypothetical protein